MTLDEYRSIYFAIEYRIENAGIENLTDPTDALPIRLDEDPEHAAIVAALGEVEPLIYEYCERENPCGGLGWGEDSDNYDWNEEHTLEEEESQMERENARHDAFLARLVEAKDRFYATITDAEYKEYLKEQAREEKREAEIDAATLDVLKMRAGIISGATDDYYCTIDGVEYSFGRPCDWDERAEDELYNELFDDDGNLTENGKGAFSMFRDWVVESMDLQDENR